MDKYTPALRITRTHQINKYNFPSIYTQRQKYICVHLFRCETLASAFFEAELFHCSFESSATHIASPFRQARSMAQFYLNNRNYAKLIRTLFIETMNIHIVSIFVQQLQRRYRYCAEYYSRFVDILDRNK